MGGMMHHVLHEVPQVRSILRTLQIPFRHLGECVEIFRKEALHNVFKFFQRANNNSITPIAPAITNIALAFLLFKFTDSNFGTTNSLADLPVGNARLHQPCDTALGALQQDGSEPKRI